MEVAAAADVAVTQRLEFGLRIEEGAIEAGLEDRADRPDRSGVDQFATPVRRLQAGLAVDLLQGQDARQVRKPCSG